jgi:hypothetical protein
MANNFAHLIICIQNTSQKSYLAITISILPSTQVAELISAPACHMIAPFSLLNPELALWTHLVAYRIA